MELRRKQRVIAGCVETVLALAGTAIAAVLGACGVTQGEGYRSSVSVLDVIDLSFLLAILIVEIVSLFKISDSTVHTVCIAASLLGYCLFSADSVLFAGGLGLALSARACDCVDFAFFLLVDLSVLWFWNYTYKLAFGRRLWIPVLVGAAASLALYVGLSFVGLGTVALGVSIAVLAGALAAMYRRVHLSGATDFAFFTTEALLFAMLGARLVVTLCTDGILAYPPVGFSSFYVLFDILLFALIYVAYAMRTDRAALLASEYKLRYEQIRGKALRAQIKPHFIFNSLAAIQSLYHKSLEDGDRATSLFSRHLRANVEAADVDLIPFERELDNVQIFVDLENMRFEKPFNVLFDIEETNFVIPILSLQPFVENAMRYSRVNEKPDGFIRISTHATERGLVLSIVDNGVGFDVAAVGSASFGLRNACERFAVLIGVEPRIESAAGVGTTITIPIPPSAQRSSDEDHHSR